jgi:hypothetical protein
MTATTVERKLTAILSADVKGYRRLMGEDEVGTLCTLTAHREVTDSFSSTEAGSSAPRGIAYWPSWPVQSMLCSARLRFSKRSRPKILS